jgi:hypothetical protein
MLQVMKCENSDPTVGSAGSWMGLFSGEIIYVGILYTQVHASWVEFNNCSKRCGLFSLLHYCRQLYMFQVSTPIIRSWYSCNYSFWYWLTALIVQQDATYSVCYITVGSCTCFGCWHPSSGAGTAVITASGTGQPGLLPSAVVVGLEQLNNDSGW